MRVSLVFISSMAAMGMWWEPLFARLELMATSLKYNVKSVLTTAVSAMVYTFMQYLRMSWEDVWAGAAATALLFAVGKSLIGMYIGKSAISSGFGAAGSLVVVLVWVYYSAQIFLLGAEFTKVFSHVHGSRKRMATPRADG